MKNTFTAFAVLLPAVLLAQPVLVSTELQAGMQFELYSLSNVNTSVIALAGADVDWDLSSTTATLVGTAALEDMESTPYAEEYPNANFAIKITPTGLPSMYSLFNLTSTVLEEVANNVGSMNPSVFTNPRTTLVFPYTYGLSNEDSYQKQGASQKLVTNTYDGYGVLTANLVSTPDVVRNAIIDDGNTSFNFWSSSPMVPMFQASSNGFILWKTVDATSIAEHSENSLFSLYPNPVSDRLIIYNKKQLRAVEIYDNSGALQFTTAQSVIDISGLAAGVYFIRAYAADEMITERFVKE